MRVKGVMSWSKGGYEKQNERRESKLHNHVQACGEQRKWEDILGLAVVLGLLEHPFVVDGNGYGEEIPGIGSVSHSVLCICCGRVLTTDQ